ncbi:MAG: PAS domain-containing protein, partial [Rubrivivax sp.]
MLLDHLARGDPRHALLLLVSALGSALGGPCGLKATAGWQLGSIGAGQQTLPLQRLGQDLGHLHAPASADATALHGLLPTAAALLLRDLETGNTPRRSEQGTLVQAALAGADTFVWEWDIDSDWLSDIDEGLQLLGYAPHAIGHTQDDWNALIHPDDRETNHEAYLRHERGEVETYESTYRARAASGQWRWLLERGRIVERHPDGRPRRMLGTQTDVTERRALTERLTRISQHVPGALYQFRLAGDGSSTFPYVSERSSALFGVEPADMLRDANSLLGLVDPADRERLVRSVLASARDLTRWRLDFRLHRRGDGALRW